MRHPRRANHRKPHDRPRQMIAIRKKDKRRFARGLANVIESLH